LTQLNRRKRRGWSRDWEGQLSTDSAGFVYLLDGSTVAALGSDGKDRWRASLEGLRRLAGPFTCGGDALYHGLSGLQRVAARVTSRGAVLRQIELDRGAILLGAGSNCEPLVWRDGEIVFVNERGHPQWRMVYKEIPDVHRVDGGFIIIGTTNEHSVRLDTVSDAGKVSRSARLPVAGRIPHTAIIGQPGLDVAAVGLCLGVNSPCARPNGTRGPFNVLVIPSERTGYRVLERHIKGHLGFAVFPPGGIVVATSAEEGSTDIALRDSTHAIVWQRTVPGRLSAGPYVGPSNEIYVATCRTWECEPPYILVSITGQGPSPDQYDLE
jgi:hypothetical protein